MAWTCDKCFVVTIAHTAERCYMCDTLINRRTRGKSESGLNKSSASTSKLNKKCFLSNYAPSQVASRKTITGIRWISKKCFILNTSSAERCICCDAIKDHLTCCKREDGLRKTSLGISKFDKKRFMSTCESTQVTSTKKSLGGWKNHTCFVLTTTSNERCICCDNIGDHVTNAEREIRRNLHLGCNFCRQSSKDGRRTVEKQLSVIDKKWRLRLCAATLNYRRSCSVNVDTENLPNITVKYCGAKTQSTKRFPVKRKSSILLDEPKMKMANIENPVLNNVVASSASSASRISSSSCLGDKFTHLDSANGRSISSFNPPVPTSNNNEAENPLMPTLSRPVLRAVRRPNK